MRLPARDARITELHESGAWRRGIAKPQQLGGNRHGDHAGLLAGHAVDADGFNAFGKSRLSASVKRHG